MIGQKQKKRKKKTVGESPKLSTEKRKEISLRKGFMIRTERLDGIQVPNAK